MGSRLISVISLLRPKQWIKNVFVLLPVFFGAKITDIDSLLRSMYAFLAFCLISSAIYCLNDIMDADSDRKHAVKRFRPIANGDVSIAMAYSLMALLVVLSLAIEAVLIGEPGCMLVLLLYFVINVAYSIRIKHYPIIDVITIAIGFVLRVVIGGLASGIWVSQWMIIMTFLITLFIALSKRRDDVTIYETTGIANRANIDLYNSTFMNSAMAIVASVTLVAYIMYTMSPETILRLGSPYLYITSVFVLIGIMRFLQLAVVRHKSGSPTEIMLHDRYIICSAIGWILSFAIIIYL